MKGSGFRLYEDGIHVRNFKTRGALERYVARHPSPLCYTADMVALGAVVATMTWASPNTVLFKDPLGLLFPFANPQEEW